MGELGFFHYVTLGFKLPSPSDLQLSAYHGGHAEPSADH